MITVITYGTFDLLHYGHINILKRAKALGDYLIVGVTADDFDRQRGKINVQQPLEERIAAVQATGLADKIIIEEYEGQKIDDVKRYNVDIFTVGSDQDGYFDYLKEFCNVIYLPRTNGVSSSSIRAGNNPIKLGMSGYSAFLNKVYNESQYVNSIVVQSVYTQNSEMLENIKNANISILDNYNKMLSEVDAVYINSHPEQHYNEIKTALNNNKHVLCESPVTLNELQYNELKMLAKSKRLIFMEAIKTAYLLAYSRLLLCIKSGKIGDVVSIDATCTSLRTNDNFGQNGRRYGSMKDQGPTALLPVLQILGTDFTKINFFSIKEKNDTSIDLFTSVNILYKNATATVKVGTGVKSEGELIISGTKGYIYVPAPQQKTDYFEIRYENPADNKRCFYQLDGDGMRYELVAFANSIKNNNTIGYINEEVTKTIAKIMELYQEATR